MRRTRSNSKPWLGAAILTMMVAVPSFGDMVFYTFQFQTSAAGQPLPSGGFGYDAASGVFADFFVVYNGATYDFTPAANRINGNTRLPYELGTIGPNLINGYGPLGPDYSHWYAGTNGFYGFEWRTPAQDFLTFDLTIDAPRRGNRASTYPGAYGGTWRTTPASVSAVPEPATWSLLALALAAGAAVQRRRKS